MVPGIDFDFVGGPVYELSHFVFYPVSWEKRIIMPDQYFLALVCALDDFNDPVFNDIDIVIKIVRGEFSGYFNQFPDYFKSVGFLNGRKRFFRFRRPRLRYAKT